MRTYSSRPSRLPCPSSPPSELTSSPPTSPSLKRKRPLTERDTVQNTPPSKKQSRASLFPPKRDKKPAQTKLKLGFSGKEKGKEREKEKKLTQLHFAIDTTIIRTCPLCDLSYTKGAPDDESLHRAHCARVQRGLEWGKEEERELAKVGVEELASGVKLKNGTKGRIICFRPDVSGKIGAKFTTLLDTIRLALSSPPLSPSVLQQCKVYLFLLPSATSTSSREKIVGCVIAQRITTAMAIATTDEMAIHPPASSHTTSDPSTSEHNPLRSLIPVDTTTNLYVRPAPLPTPMGIPRLFVSSSHRRLGIATHLLAAAASTFILGCPLDPAKGEVAFTQPTGAGKAVLEAWGKGGIRIYEEEQLR
ncbi:hypothetical protein CERSUDRAFT_64600 [Gelatoporia subvermispora B]|uniref:N-acetyltransferase ECO1 n=1 Tax=Ceriporiopsis subvermispora (strain B) TaxID=914234 RepID=M2QMS6_CERS8|nr:hypothetical protein CERSUDRAFT_64600 [Gelatoporia subvermispora B]